MTSIITGQEVQANPALALSNWPHGYTCAIPLPQSIAMNVAEKLPAHQPIRVQSADNSLWPQPFSSSPAEVRWKSQTPFFKQRSPVIFAETVNWDALTLEKSLLELKHVPDLLSLESYLCILQKCRKRKSSDLAMLVHLHLCSHGVDTHYVLESHLVSLFVECDVIPNAQIAFNRLKQRTEFVWTCLMQGYVDSGDPRHALDLVQCMKADGLTLSKFTFVTLLKACARLQLLERGHDLHEELKGMGLGSDLFVGSMLVDMYAKCGSIAKAQEVFDGLSNRSIVSWTALIGGYAEHGPAEKALKCLDLMNLEGVSPDTGCYICILKACGNLESLKKGFEIYCEVLKKGLEEDQILNHVLMDMYAKCNALEEAQGVFDRLRVRNVVSWTILITRYSDHGHNKEALKCLERMQGEGGRPNDITLVCSLRACRDLGALNKGREIHELIVREELEKVPYVCNTLIDFYVKFGKMEEAHHVFSELPMHDVILWTTLITGYADCKQCDKAVSCFQEMQREGLTPDVPAYNAVILVCAEQGNFEKAFKTFLQMQERGLLPNNTTIISVLKACKNKSALAFGRSVHAQLMMLGGQRAVDIQLATVLLDMYAKCGNMLMARHVFDDMPSRDTVAFTSLIAGYAGQGESNLAYELLYRMEQEGMCPDGETFLSVLIACTHAGLVEEGQIFFESMNKDFGIEPTIEHLNCVIDLLGRVGRLSEAVLMLNQSTVPPDEVMWGTLLNACRKWHDVQVARHAFGCAIAINKVYTPAYALMANIYADAQLWNEARMIEEMRNKQG